MGTEFKESQETNNFSIKDRTEYFKKKWKREHRVSMTIEMIII